MKLLNANKLTISKNQGVISIFLIIIITYYYLLLIIKGSSSLAPFCLCGMLKKAFYIYLEFATQFILCVHSSSKVIIYMLQ
jgi:hypothetical protein